MNTTIRCLLLVVCSAVAARGATYRFHLTDEWSWGGQVLATPRALLPAMSAKPTLRKQPRYGAAFPAHATIPLEKQQTGHGINVVLVTPKQAPPQVYVDADGDLTLTPAEGVVLRENAGDCPFCVGRLSAPFRVNVEVKQKGKTRSVAREGVIWQGANPKIPLFAFRGFLQGKVRLDGAARDAFLVDANANGAFNDVNADQLWIDLNADGKLDPVTEEFPVRPLVRLGNRRYNLSVSPLDDTLDLTPATETTGTVQVELPANRGTVTGLSATLVGADEEVVSVRRTDKPVELPVGNYQLASLWLEMKSKGGEVWQYDFADRGVADKGDAYPVKVTQRQTTRLNLADMKLSANCWGEKQVGGELSVAPCAVTQGRLALVNAVRSDRSPFDENGPHAVVTLISPAGKVAANAVSGFS